MEEYEVRDTIYGFIPFNDWEKEIINHPVFQRLRRIRQLGFTNLVYPGAMHTRFEHSLGVMHLTTLMFDAIINNEKNKELLKKQLVYEEAGFKKDRQLVRLAALLHDVGHAPFSHASEEIMPINGKTNMRFNHEDYSIEIIKGPLKDSIESNQFNKSNYNIKAEDVAALLEGNARIIGEKIFWKELISSQLDADRGDYLLRDSHHIGVKYGVYDYPRLLNTLSLGIDPEDGSIRLGISEEGWRVAEAIVFARYQIFTQVYFHKTRRAYDYHLSEILRSFLNDKYSCETLPSPENIERFLTLDDYIVFDFIKNHPEIEDCKMIMDRKHIRRLYSTPEKPDDEDEKDKESKIEILNENGIWFFEDKADRTWYKLNEEGEENREIMIIDIDSNPKPLSQYSRIAENISEIKQICLYVKCDDKERAKEVLKL